MCSQLNISSITQASPATFVIQLLIILSLHETKVLYDSAQQHEASSDWVQAAEKWRACVNETLRQSEECRAQCVVAPQPLPDDRGAEGGSGVFEKAAGNNQTTHDSFAWNRTGREHKVSVLFPI